jgi:hypothetical protein
MRSRLFVRESRTFRLLRTAVFGVAILIGIAAAVVVIAGGDPATLRNPSRLYSPSGHLPGQVSSEQSVSMSWTGVEGAAGYWWAMVADPSLLPKPWIRPSGDDRRVYFRLTGIEYFVLRTAFRVDGKLHWTDEMAYGPIVVRDSTGRVPGATASPGGPEASGEPGSGSGSTSDGSTRGGTAFGGPTPAPTPVDPRYAGQAGECPPGSTPAQCGGAGQPGQPAQEPGSGGNSPGRPGNAPGQPGPDGADGPDGPP